ncbi:MAG: serine/threonine protein kinase [Coprococcus sp.]|nr:serine/threonine protein kinase [Coprococcus sp.]
MSNSNSQGMRMSLPPGTKVCGERGTYIIKNFICMSSRSTTVLCESSNGSPFRLKLYNGQHCINSDIQKKMKTVATKGVIVPIDSGKFGGCPFFVYQNVDGTDTSKYPISLNVLVQKIIPQLAFVINQYHRNRILLRDISPENVLYRVQEQQIAYCGFNNMVILPAKATITKANGYGQHSSFIAPEVPKYGYSICSDYYSLGVTILSMMLGKNPMQLMKWDEIQKCLKTGTVPGIDINHLRNTPYDFYSEEDKVMYLVLGLMLPNPSERWGYGEIRCWCNGQHIPLTRKDGKIVYQYNEPFIVGNYKCWNYQQLTRVIAANSGAWNDTTYTRLDEFAKKQNITIWKQISDANKDSGLTANGRIFRAIYGINPALDGFWWSGKKYADTSDLIREVATNKTVAGVLSEILKNHSMSYFLRMRKRISSVSETEISEMEQIEQWEISEPDKGVNRCIMKFSSNAQARSFWVGEKEYKNIDQLLGNYANSGLQLKKISCEILNNKNFQAWLWANGMEDAGRVAQKMGTAHPEQGFYLLLKIAESVSKSEDSKKLARKIYLTYGEYAPVYWLVEKTDNYKMVSIGDQILFDTFKDANLSLMDSIEKLSAKASQLVADYQHFVSRTAKSPLEVECVDLEFCDFSFYPLKEDGFFCCKWENDLEVTPAFLRAIGESIQKKTLETWSEKSVKAVDEKLDRIIQSLPVYGADTPGKSAYIGQCNSNIVAAIVSMFVSAGILLWFAHYTLIGWGSFFASLVFPICMLFWYYQKRARANFYFDKKSSHDNERAIYQGIRDGLTKRASDIVNRINNNTVRTLSPFQSFVNTTVDQEADIDGLVISNFLLFLGAISTIGVFSMCYFYSRGLFYIIVNSILIGYLIIAKRVKSCLRWAISTGLLLIPLIANLFYMGSVATFFLEAAVGAGVWCMNNNA